MNTLVLVHRTELLAQWQERLQTFLDGGENLVGVIGGGKHKPTGQIDIAVMQSLSRKGEIDDIVERYGQVVVDECHHLSAFSFEAILKHAKARYVLGLTATPVRRDGQHPIIFMQCGPIRHTAITLKRSGSSSTALSTTCSCSTGDFATGRLIGEGFDHPPLDTLVLAMPISWKGNEDTGQWVI